MSLFKERVIKRLFNASPVQATSSKLARDENRMETHDNFYQNSPELKRSPPSPSHEREGAESPWLKDPEAAAFRKSMEQKVIAVDRLRIFTFNGIEIGSNDELSMIDNNSYLFVSLGKSNIYHD